MMFSHLTRSGYRSAAWLRAQFRSSEIWFIGLAIVIGTVAGGLVFVQSEAARLIQGLLYQLGPGERLSSSSQIAPILLIWLPLGGLCLGLVSLVTGWWRTRPLVDVVEANALYGGRMSIRESLFICLQTLISNGAGASVGLEAAFAQAGGAVASAVGKALRLRRQDLRILVGAGAGAAIGAAFGAPLTGAFYAFEIVIGTYAPSMIAPVAAAALASVLASEALGGAHYSISVAVQQSPTAVTYAVYGGLGILCALAGMSIMRLAATAEKLVRRVVTLSWLRPLFGGVMLAAIAYASPQVLSSGHGALHEDLASGATLQFLLVVFLLKSAASVVSLGSGFRGGLFFASLFLGSLLGQLYAGSLNSLFVILGSAFALDPETAALVGMGALGAAIVGGPLTMSFLVLETTGDFGVTAVTLAATLIASTIVRERFGYSFSTWRLHLRGETIRSARDVGWMRTLTAGRMMRRDPALLPASSRIAELRRRYPLGSTSRIILTDDMGNYAGIVMTERAYVDGADPEALAETIATSRSTVLRAEMNIEQVMQTFDETETEELAVVQPDGAVLGSLSEIYVSRRYSKELEKIQLGLFGESRGTA